MRHTQDQSLLPQRYGLLNQQSPAADAFRHLAVEMHVDSLLEWLQGEDGRVGEILCDEMQYIYVEMCLELCISPRPWRSVASALRRRLGGKKNFRQTRDTEGKRRRMVVWHIPERAPPIRLAA